jgi:hypothetical protein
MPTPPIPVDRYLVPAAKPAAPDGFTPLTSTAQAGLPHTIQLDQGTRLILTVPTGLAGIWRDADPSLVVSCSDEELAPSVPHPDDPIGSVDRAPARLLLQIGGATVASLPLVAGLRRIAPDQGRSDVGVRIELVVLSWTITAGSMRGPGDFGTRISLAWRTANRAIDQFSTPPPNPVLVKRLPLARKMESQVGLKFRTIDQARFNVKRAVIK